MKKTYFEAEFEDNFMYYLCVGNHNLNMNAVK